MKNILAENLLRFGVKNLTLESKSSILTEQTEPDLSAYDWSKNGTIEWDNAKISDIIKYIMARDANQPFTNLEVYKPIFEWFEKHKSYKVTRESLLIWCGDDPFYGLAKARENRSTYDDPGSYSYSTSQLGKDWISLINSMKSVTTEDKQVIANLNLIATAYTKAGQLGLEDFKSTEASTFKTKGLTIGTPPMTLKYLPNGGYTKEDVILSKKIATRALNRLSSKNTGNDRIDTSSATNLALIKADNVNRTKLLFDIEKQVQEKIKNPIFRDTIAPGIKSIPIIIKKADLLYFTKEEIKTNIGTQEEPGAADTVAVVEFAWPAASELGTETADNFASTFFPDDGIKTSSEAKKGMEDIAGRIYDEIYKAKQKFGETFEVVSIAINAFASTSTVNSSYGSKIKTYNKQNNIKLVKARLAAMQNDMKDELLYALDLQRTGLRDGKNETPINKIIVGQQQNYANAGPEWEFVGGNSYGQKYSINNYGPLFQDAYKQNPKLTPKQFYSVQARRTNSSIKQDYEVSFGGYRKAYIWVSLTMKGAEAPNVQPLDVVISISGDFGAYIQWPDNRRVKLAKGSKKTRYNNRPKDNMPIFDGRKTLCTF